MHLSSKLKNNISFNRVQLSLVLLWALLGVASRVTGQGQLELVIEKLDSTVNSDVYHESSPVISLDGRFLYFTRTGSPDFERTLISGNDNLAVTLDEETYIRTLASIYTQIGNREIADPVISPFNQDIWIATLDGGQVAQVYHPGWPLNSALPNSVVSASLDSGSVVVLNQFYADGSMYEGFSLVEHLDVNVFSAPLPLHVYDFYNNSEEANVALSRSGHIAIFSLAREDSRGENDLYLSFKIKDGLWSAPEPLAENINSPFRESMPYITNNGRQLYFASDRPGSLGGMDIWVSNRLDYTWKRWSEPARLDAPINSRWDDSQGCIDEKGDYFYFTSKRDGTSDIFRASLVKYGKLKRPLNIEMVVLEGESEKPIRAEIYCKPMSSRNYLEYFHTHSGYYYTVFTEYETYEVFARKPGHQPARVWFDAARADTMPLDTHRIILRLYPAQGASGAGREVLAQASPDPVARKQGERQPVGTITSNTVNLSSYSTRVDTLEATQKNNPGKASSEIVQQIRTLQVGQRLTFFNIYFQRTTPIVLKESYSALDQLVEGLQQNPDVRIRIEGHTDNRGNEKDLMELSWKRAEAVKAYVVLKGVNPARVSTIGFGSQKPIAPNYDELNRSRNRRVEIRIISR